MASYLGKISALVTANTGPFRSALNATKQDLNQWRNEVNRTLNTAAAGNWEKKILLPIQQIERAIRDANREPLSIGIDEAMVSRIRQMARLTEGIAEPLAQAVGQFKSMGGAIQTALLPALQRVQNAALEMKDEISEGTAKSEADFQRLERQTDRLTQALSRAREASALVSAVPTGREFRFNQPAAASAMMAAASNVSTAERVLGAGDPRVATFAAASNARARLIARLSAERDDYELSGMPFLAADAQSRIDRAVRKQQAEEASIDRAVRKKQAEGASIAVDPTPTFAGRLRQEAAEAERRRGAAFDAVGFGRGIAGISQSLNQQELSGRIGQLQALRRGLAGVAAEASGPAVRAISRLRDVIAEAFDQGTLDSAPVRRNIEALTAEAVAATARASGVSENKVRRDVRRAGDIARGGFDKLGLGLQQAVFAVEDFFSVTGGLDQRLRAAGNNISQLGFLMGGLGGLVAGVSVAIGGQLAVALYKYLNSGVASEDQTRSLTAALDEQKRKAEDLKSVFDSLGKAMADATLSPTGRSEAEQRRGVQAAIDAIKAARDAKIFALDPGVQRESGIQIAAERRLSQATTPAQAATALGEIEQAKAAVEAAKAAAVARATTAVLPQDQFNAQVQRIRDDAATRAANATRAAGVAGGGMSVGGVGEDIIRQAEARIAEMVADRNRQEDFQRFEALLAGGAMRGLNFANAGAKNAALGLGLIQQAFGGDARTSEILRRMDLVSSDRALAVNALGSAATSPIFGDAGNATIVEANRVQAALNGAAKAMQGFADISGKVSQSISADVSTLEQRSEKLRRESLAGLPGAMEDASRAAEVAANARSLQQEASDTIAVARKRVEQQVLGEDNARLGQIEIAIQSPNIKAETLDALLAERRQIMAKREVAMEADPGVQAAMELRDQASAMAERAAMADRGRELSMTPGQRAARDLGRKLEEVRQDFQDRDPNNVAGQQQAMRRVFNDAARQAAPMVFGFADEVLTARLQGPSREPLNFTDVATMEGQREFNRLLRRDDPSRDVNLSELQKQTGYLAEIANTARNFGVGVAN